MMTVKYILPFKDKPELLKKPPTEYDFIDEEYWNIFVKNRLLDEFQGTYVIEIKHNTFIHIILIIYFNL